MLFKYCAALPYMLKSYIVLLNNTSTKAGIFLYMYLILKKTLNTPFKKNVNNRKGLFDFFYLSEYL